MIKYLKELLAALSFGAGLGMFIKAANGDFSRWYWVLAGILIFWGLDWIIKLKNSDMEAEVMNLRNELEELKDKK